MKLSQKEKLVSAVIGFVIGACFVLYAVVVSTNSTASIGLLFIPVYGAFGALLSLVGYWSLKADWLTRFIFILISLVLGFGYYEKSENLKSASDPQTPASYLVDLAQTRMLFSKEDILMALAENPSSPPELLQKLSANESISIRAKVAANPSTDLDVLSRLGQEKLSYILHAALASNPNVPQAVVDRILSAVSSDFSSETEYKLYQTYVLGKLARLSKLSYQDFVKITQIKNPEYFLVFGIIESGRADCDLLRRYRDGEYGALRGNADSQLKKQGCAP